MKSRDLKVGKFYAVSDVNGDYDNLQFFTAVDSVEAYYFAIYDDKGVVKTMRWSTPKHALDQSYEIKPVSQGNFTSDMKRQTVVSLFEEISNINY